MGLFSSSPPTLTTAGTIPWPGPNSLSYNFSFMQSHGGLQIKQRRELKGKTVTLTVTFQMGHYRFAFTAPMLFNGITSFSNWFPLSIVCPSHLRPRVTGARIRHSAKKSDSWCEKHTSWTSVDPERHQGSITSWPTFLLSHRNVVFLIFHSPPVWSFFNFCFMFLLHNRPYALSLQSHYTEDILVHKILSE